MPKRSGSSRRAAQRRRAPTPRRTSIAPSSRPRRWPSLNSRRIISGISSPRHPATCRSPRAYRERTAARSTSWSRSTASPFSSSERPPPDRGGANLPQRVDKCSVGKSRARHGTWPPAGRIPRRAACGEIAAPAPPKRRADRNLAVGTRRARASSSISGEGFQVTRPSERIIAIAALIEQYVTEHPRAADTPKGVCEWWVAGQGYAASPAEVREALNHLVGGGRLHRTVLADGTAIYARAGPAN